jgi:pimeloyl-ACP methyl ester carboxylesterase
VSWVGEEAARQTTVAPRSAFTLNGRDRSRWNRCCRRTGRSLAGRSVCVSTRETLSTTRGSFTPALPGHARRWRRGNSFLLRPNGARIAYTAVGCGPPLVQVPPLMSHLEAMWQIDGHRRFCTRLAEQHTVVTYDRWGSGLSDRDREDMSHAADVDVLAGLIAHLKLRPVSLYGPSQGGPVAMEYADRYPQAVASLVLFGMSLVSRAGGPTWMALRELMLADWSVAAPAVAAVLCAGADQEEQATFARLLQAGVTAEMAVDSWRPGRVETSRSSLNGSVCRPWSPVAVAIG